MYDDDGDGYCEEPPCLNTTETLEDCNDSNAGANPHPSTTEAINGIDDNCNGLVDDGTAVFDDDGDGYSEADGDCDDTTIAKVKEIAVSLNKVPDIPSIKINGKKTATKTKVVEIIAKVILFEPLKEATKGVSPFSTL